MQIFTLRNLAEINSVPDYSVSYAIRVHGLEPTQRVGKGMRLWSEDDLPRIREALRKTGALRPDTDATLAEETA